MLCIGNKNTFQVGVTSSAKEILLTDGNEESVRSKIYKPTLFTIFILSIGTP